MTKAFVDTNVWVRYFLNDNPEQFSQAQALFQHNETGAIQLYTSDLIFLEVNYALKSIYKFKFEEVLEALEGMKTTRNITIISGADLDLALSFFKTYKIKFSDCLIASQIRKDIICVTFDKELGKVKEITTKTPAEVLVNLKQ